MRLFQKVARKKGVFITLLLSYVIILLFPVTVGTYVYHRIENLMVTNANKTNLGLLEQVKLVAENRFAEIDKMNVKMAFNPKVQFALSIIDDDYTRSQFNSSDIIKEIKSVRNTSSFVGDFFVYFKNTDTVLTSTGKSDAKTFFKELLVYDKKGLDQIINEMFTGQLSNAYLPATRIKQGGKVSQPITFIQSLPLGEKTNIKGYLVVLFNEQEFDRLIQQINKVNRSSIYIVDSNKQVILSNTEKHQLSTDVLAKMNYESGYESYQQDGESMIFSYTTSQNGWKYISVMPKDMVLEQVITLKNEALTLLLLCLLIGIVISYFMTYRNYSPIRDVVKTIMKENDHTSEDNTNEFDYIKQSIIRSVQEKNQLKQKLSEHIPVIQANFLSRLVKGHVEVADINDESLKFMGVFFNNEYFSAMIIEIDDCREFISEDTEREWALVRFVLSNLSRDLLWEQGYIVEMDRGRLTILNNTSSPSEETYQFRDAFVKKLKNMAQQRFKLNITISISQFHQGVENIGRCYREALLALDYRMVYGQNEGIYYSEIANLEQYYYQYPMETEIQLMNYVKVGDFVNAERVLEQIYELNFQLGRISPEMGRSLFYDLLSSLIKVMNGLNLSDKKLFENSFDPVKNFAGCTKAEEMFEKTKELYRNICGHLKENKTEHGDRLHARITRYIEEHFFDSNVSLVSIADHFQITSQYLSNFFKKHSGQKISDYISEVRIVHAKKMLNDRSLTLTEIAHKIGYANDVGFVRFFKKYEGVPPGKYREMIEQSTNKKNE